MFEDALKYHLMMGIAVFLLIMGSLGIGYLIGVVL